MKILFIEINYKGHHISLYAKKLLEKFYKNNEVYFLTSIKASQSEEFKSIKNLNKKIQIKTIETKDDIQKKNNISIFLYHLWNLCIVYKSAINLIKKKKIDHVYFNHFDPYIFIFSIFFFLNFNAKVYGLLLNIKFHQYYFKFRKKTFLDEIKFYLFKRFIKKNYLKKIFFIDPLFINFLNFKNIRSEKIIHINEAVNKNINFIKKKTKKKTTILIYGEISKRKNFKFLIDLLVNSKLINNIKLVIAGKFDLESKKIITSKKYSKILKEKRVIVKDYFINLREEMNLFTNTDLVWLCYAGGSDGSSGVLQMAIDNIKPVIYYNRGLINNICQNHELGFKISYNYNELEQLNKLLLSKNLDQRIQLIKKNIKKYKKNIKEELIFEDKIYKEITKDI